MKERAKSIAIAIIIAAVVFGVTTLVSAATDSLPKGVNKFQDGDVTCFTYFKTISCVNNPQPKPYTSGSYDG